MAREKASLKKKEKSDGKKGTKNKSDKTQKFEEIFEKAEFKPQGLRAGEIVEGVVIKKEPREILVDLSSKAEGVISGREIRGEEDFLEKLKVGDKIIAYVLSPENEDGQIVLSLKRTGMERKWRFLEKEYEAGRPIEVKVLDYNKGGLIVDAGVRGFVPLSHIGFQYLDLPGIKGTTIRQNDLGNLVNQKFKAKILEVDREENKLILSGKLYYEEAQKEEILEDLRGLKRGEKFTAKILRIMPFGLLVDLGGIEGLVHISEISWKHLQNLEKLYRIGQEAEVMILDIDEQNRKVNLSMKRLIPDPWKNLSEKYPIGKWIEGEVTRIVPFGFFVRLEEGIDGLVHISEIPGEASLVKKGDKVKVRVISLDEKRHRMGLSLKKEDENS